MRSFLIKLFAGGITLVIVGIICIVFHNNLIRQSCSEACGEKWAK